MNLNKQQSPPQPCTHRGFSKDNVRNSVEQRSSIGRTDGNVAVAVAIHIAQHCHAVAWEVERCEVELNLAERTQQTTLKHVQQSESVRLIADVYHHINKSQHASNWLQQLITEPIVKNGTA